MNHILTPVGNEHRSGDCIKVDRVVLSHPHIDHYNSFEELLDKKKLKLAISSCQWNSLINLLEVLWIRL